MQQRGLIWLTVAVFSGACASQGEGTEPAEEATDGTDGSSNVDIPDNDDNLVPLSSDAGPEGVLFQSVAVSNGYVWACTGNNGLHVAKTGADGQLSVAVQEGVLGGEAKGCRDVQVGPDGAVFVSGQSGGGSFISQIDNAPGDTVNVMSTVAVEGLVESIAVTATHVFAAAGEAGLRIYGRNDGALAEVAHLSSGFDLALGLGLWGDKVVVANGLSGLVVVDVSDPTNPAILDSYEAYGTSRRVQMVGDHAYVASVAGGVGVYDLSSNKPFPPMGGWATHGSSVDLAVANDLVYVANLDDLCVLDASNPSDLVLLGSELVGADGGANPRVADVAIDGDIAYAAEWSGIWSYTFVDGREAADIHLSKTSLDFGLVSLKKGKGIIIKNLGQKTLEISSVSVTNELFSFDDDDAKKIQPGDSGFLQVVFEAVDEEPAEGFLILTTNDPDEGEIKMPLKANSLDGIQIGAPFDNDGELVYQEYKSGNDTTVKQAHPGKVVLLAYFATW